MQNNICKILSAENLQQIAVSSKFYKRSSKMLPAKFFDILMHSASVNTTYSLARFSGEAALTYGVSISKQAFDARFDKTAVSFVKGVLDQVIANQIKLPIEASFLEKFKSIKLKDSTRFDIPNCLKEHFPGFGGKVTSEAGISIQCELDLKNNCIHELDITSAKKNDVTDAKEKINDIEKGDLIIRDLGYFSSKILKSIIEKKAFFLSRLKSKMTVFDKNQEELSFKKIYNKMIESQMTRYHLQATIGEKEKVPVRLMIELMPDEIYQERIRKMEKENKKRKQKTSDEYKIRAHFNLMVTNIPEKDLPAENIYMLYKIRWQIELMFKTWKSVMGINQIHPMKYHRLLCLLYAKLTLFLINNQITGLFARKFYNRKEKKILSINKCMNTLSLYFSKTRKLITEKPLHLNGYIHDINNLLAKNHWLEKRKNKVSFLELIDIFC